MPINTYTFHEQQGVVIHGGAEGAAAILNNPCELGIFVLSAIANFNPPKRLCRAGETIDLTPPYATMYPAWYTLNVSAGGESALYRITDKPDRPLALHSQAAQKSEEGTIVLHIPDDVTLTLVAAALVEDPRRIRMHTAITHQPNRSATPVVTTHSRILEPI